MRRGILSPGEQMAGVWQLWLAEAGRKRDDGHRPSGEQLHRVGDMISSHHDVISSYDALRRVTASSREQCSAPRVSDQAGLVSPYVAVVTADAPPLAGAYSRVTGCASMSAETHTSAQRCGSQEEGVMRQEHEQEQQQQQEQQREEEGAGVVHSNTNGSSNGDSSSTPPTSLCPDYITVPTNSGCGATLQNTPPALAMCRAPPVASATSCRANEPAGPLTAAALEPQGAKPGGRKQSHITGSHGDKHRVGTDAAPLSMPGLTGHDPVREPAVTISDLLVQRITNRGNCQPTREAGARSRLEEALARSGIPIARAVTGAGAGAVAVAGAGAGVGAGAGAEAGGGVMVTLEVIAAAALSQAAPTGLATGGPGGIGPAAAAAVETGPSATATAGLPPCSSSLPPLRTLFHFPSLHSPLHLSPPPPLPPPRSLQLPQEVLNRLGMAVRPLPLQAVRALTLALSELVAAGDVVRGYH